ncbi:MAG: DUF5071 domain-containing protein [Candidatus Riflebacteria bacterium]|nr:DUF5071 domain-containing protein [Candidatus Riflebacteria bacterium]
MPADKHDLDACARLEAATDAQVVRCLPALLEWLQDINWPVALPIVRRLGRLGVQLAEPLRPILQGADGMWKYWLLAHLVPEAGSELVRALAGEIRRLAADPTPDDRQAEVHLAAAELLLLLPAGS